MLHEVENKLATLQGDVWAFDLIVMGTSGAGGLKEKLWGSNTAGIIFISPLPILVIPH